MIRKNPDVSKRAEAAGALLSEGRLRVFEPGDLPRVAGLYDRVFSHGDGKSLSQLCENFEEMFFKNPWADPRVPSWVYETNKGDIKAFMAVYPHRMVFDGKPIMCSALGHWMVSEDYRGRKIGLLLLRHVLQTGPELSYSDSAERRGLGATERLGGARLPVAGFQWAYVLRGEKASHAAKGARKILRLPRSVVNGVRFRKRRSRLEPLLEGARISGVDPRVLERLPEMLPGDVRLYPQYDAEYVAWMLKVASEVFTRGELRHSTVPSREGDGIDGWYFLYLADTGKAEVLQIVSRKGAQERVLAQLLAHAHREGATIVMGQWSGPDILLAAQSIGCHIGYVPTRTAIYTRDSEIMRAVLCGKYFMSAFEGDRWLDLTSR